MRSLENGKVGDSRQGHAAPDGAQVFEGFLIVEGEDEAGNPHNLSLIHISFPERSTFFMEEASAFSPEEEPSAE